MIVLLTDDQVRIRARTVMLLSPSYLFVLQVQCIHLFDVLFGHSQDYTLGSLETMPGLRSLVQQTGLTFEHGLVNTPVCCPSRSEGITSRYGHNLYTESGGCMYMNSNSPEWKSANVGAQIKSAVGSGVRTGMFGKWLNTRGWFCGKNANQVPPGWDHFQALCTGDFFNQTYNVNGKEVPTTGYQTAVLGNATVQFIREAVGAGDRFFIYLAPHAPHIADSVFPYITQPAPWYDNATLSRDTSPRVPNWNHSGSDHHWLIRQQPPLVPFEVDWSDSLFRARWRSLLSVDDMLRSITSELIALGEFDDTGILYQADHGYSLGSLRMVSGKWNVYDNDVRIPFLMRGPGVPQGARTDAIASNIDVVPTVLDWMGGKAHPDNDGRSLMPLAQDLDRRLQQRQALEAQGKQADPATGLALPPHLDLARSAARVLARDAPGGPTGDEEVPGGSLPLLPAGPMAPHETFLIEYWGLGEVMRGAPTSPECNPHNGVCKPGCPCYFRLEDTANNTYIAARRVNSTTNVMYAEFYPNNHQSAFNTTPYFKELYDLDKDPWQMNNLAQGSQAPQGLMQELSDWMHRQVKCAGQSCEA